MGTIVDSLFTVLMSWVRALVSAIWALFTSEETTILAFLGKHWLALVVVIIAAGLVIDWLIWLIRWQPYHIWAMRMRRLLRIAPEKDEDVDFEADYEDVYRRPQPEPEPYEAPAYQKPRSHKEQYQNEQYQNEKYQNEQYPKAKYQRDPYQEDEFEEDHWLPLRAPLPSEQDAQQAMEAASSVPDEELGQYPGMRYDEQASAYAPQQTQRFSAVHNEGPGAREVNRRRAEIDAWQKQMQEEARSRARAEQEERRQREAQLAREREERLAQEAYEAEQARLAQEAYEAEQARLAQEAYEAEQARLAQEAYEAQQARLAQEAYEAEQARLAQEEYARQLAQYELEKAQYERDLAEYERQKAAYEAEMARLAAQQQSEQAQEIAPDAAKAAERPRRRRAAAAAKDAAEHATQKTYSDYVPGETVDALPEPPAWTQMSAVQAAPQKEKKSVATKKGIFRGSFAKMAQMVEPESAEIVGIASLPPRVDAKKAYKPAKRPPKL